MKRAATVEVFLLTIKSFFDGHSFIFELLDLDSLQGGDFLKLKDDSLISDHETAGMS